MDDELAQALQELSEALLRQRVSTAPGLGGNLGAEVPKTRDEVQGVVDRLVRR